MKIVKTKTLHILNHLLISLLLINLSIFLIIFHFVENLYSGGGIGFIQYILSNSISIGMGFFILLLIIWFVYFVLSYYKTEVNNKQYKISGCINISVFIFSLIYIISLPFLVILTDGIIYNWRILNYVNSILTVFIPILLLISLVISFIIFLIGYYTNKN